MKLCHVGFIAPSRQVGPYPKKTERLEVLLLAITLPRRRGRQKPLLKCPIPPCMLVPATAQAVLSTSNIKGIHTYSSNTRLTPVQTFCINPGQQTTIPTVHKPGIFSGTREPRRCCGGDTQTSGLFMAASTMSPSGNRPGACTPPPPPPPLNHIGGGSATSTATGSHSMWLLPGIVKSYGRPVCNPELNQTGGHLRDEGLAGSRCDSAAVSGLDLASRQSGQQRELPSWGGVGSHLDSSQTSNGVLVLCVSVQDVEPGDGGMSGFKMLFSSSF